MTNEIENHNIVVIDMYVIINNNNKFNVTIVFYILKSKICQINYFTVR